LVHQAKIMTIKYALTRDEIVRSYFRSLGSSPKFLLMIPMYSVGLGVLSLAIGGAFSRSLTAGDAISALAWAVGAFLFMPLWLFVRGKTKERTLSISVQSISTEIGSRKGEVPWGKVRLVENAGCHVLIVGATGNAFLIPGRAFSGPEQQAQFVQEINSWRKVVTSFTRSSRKGPFLKTWREPHHKKLPVTNWRLSLFASRKTRR